MIYFSFYIHNPFWKWTRSKTLYEKWWKVSENKNIEIDLGKSTYLLGVDFSWNIRQDHAGVRLYLGMVGYSFEFQFYDKRHWNDEDGCFYKGDY